MSYSQKYTIVHFLQPLDEGSTFSMYKWPLHTTLADVFAVERSDELMGELQRYAEAFSPITAYVERESAFGDTPIWLLKESKELRNLHNALVDILERHGAVFNTPEYTREGYVPHVTKQKRDNLAVGEKIIIDSFSIIDMFPGNDWQRRRLIKRFGP